MSQPEYAKQMKLVRSARIDLLAKKPFFADLAFGLPFEFVEDLKPPTAATDGEKIYFHPDFLLTLAPSEVVFLIAHEVLHPALLHCHRRGPRDPKLWNIACDIVVNYILIDAKVGKMPSMGIHKPDLYKQGGGKVEKIYELLVQENEQRKQNGQPQIGEGKEPGEGGQESSLDNVMDVSEERKETTAAKWRTKLESALQTAKIAGDCPGAFEEFVKNVLEPKVPWQIVLRNFLIPCKGDDRSWTKFNRRYASTGLRLPGVIGEKAGVLAYLVDCSGSVNDKMIAQNSAELLSVQAELQPEEIHIIYFDTNVKKHEVYGPEDDFEVKAYGRGGTCFRTSFEYMQQNGIEPDACVVLTDMYCSDYGPEPAFPVLWVTDTKGHDAPWGQTLIFE